jgi:hypothetical protein
LILEFTIRVFAPEITSQGTSKIIIADSLWYSSHGLRPLSSGTSNGAFVEIDRYGFRKSGTSLDTSKVCWLFLGDSVTFGIGIDADSTFTGIIQNHMHSVNILNPSTSGHNVKSYWDVFRFLVLERNDKLKINHVSIFWCLNDVYSNVPDMSFPGGKMRDVFSDFLIFLRAHSRFYYFIKTALFDRPKSYFLFDKSFYSPGNIEFKNAVQTIATMNKFCRQLGIRFDVVLLPYEYQLRIGDFTPQAQLKTALKNEMIHVLEPFAGSLDLRYDSKAYFLYGDGIHLSNLGHKHIATFVMDRIFKN